MAESLFQVFSTIKEETIEELRASVQQLQPALESAQKMQQAIIQSTIDSIEVKLKALLIEYSCWNCLFKEYSNLAEKTREELSIDLSPQGINFEYIQKAEKEGKVLLNVGGTLFETFR